MKRKLLVIVNGHPLEMEVPGSLKLSKLKTSALNDTGYASSRSAWPEPHSEWQVRDENGSLLDEEVAIAGMVLPKKDVLFITLRAGVDA